jgi:formiminoglutamase
VKREINLTEATAHALKEFDNAPLGVEVDLDSLTYMPASAFNYCGFDVSDGEHYVYLAANDPRSAYLHLCEAAPSQHPHSITAGKLQCGQVISALVNTYLQTKLSI